MATQSPTQDQSKTIQNTVGNPTVVCYFSSSEIACQYEPALATNGFTILRARHGMHAYWLAISAAPDVIILEAHRQNDKRDYILDRISSHEKTTHTPVIVFAQNADTESKADGIVSIVNKGIAPSALVAKAQAMIAKSRRERADRIDEFFSTLENVKAEIAQNDSRVLRTDDAVERVMSHIQQDKQRQENRSVSQMSTEL